MMHKLRYCKLCNIFRKNKTSNREIAKAFVKFKQYDRGNEQHQTYIMTVWSEKMTSWSKVVPMKVFSSYT